MKKIIVLTATLLSGVAVNAQVRLGLKAGYNLTDVKMETSNYFMQGIEYSSVSGFHVGLVTDVALGEHFSLQPGLFYTLGGFKGEGVVPGPLDGPVNVSLSTSYHYLELPVNFLYKYPLGPGKLFAGIGPFLSYGIKGRVKTTSTGYAAPDEKVIFLDKQRDYNSAMAYKQYIRPFNAGAGFILGYEFTSGIMISGNYSLGLTDVNPHSNISQKSRSWGISIGYLFNNDK